MPRNNDYETPTAREAKDEWGNWVKEVNNEDVDYDDDAEDDDGCPLCGRSRCSGYCM